MENDKKITYDIVITEVEYGNLDAVRAIMDMGNVEIDEAKRMIKNVPCTLCIVDDLDKVCNMTKELKEKGIIVKIQNSSVSKNEVHFEKERKNNDEAIISEEKPKSVLKRIFNFIEIAVIVVLIYAFSTGKFTLMIMDFYANINCDDYTNNPYLEMVLNYKPFDNGESYMGVFARTFDSNHWTYFKADDGQRIVQVVSYYNHIPNDKMITQFAISPTDEKGYFLIEPYAMRVSGRDLTEYEMNLVLAAVFDNEVVNALGELFLYSSFY